MTSTDISLFFPIDADILVGIDKFRFHFASSVYPYFIIVFYFPFPFPSFISIDGVAFRFASRSIWWIIFN